MDDDAQPEDRRDGMWHGSERDPGGFHPRVLPPVWAALVAVGMLAVDAACRHWGVLQLGEQTTQRLELASYALFVVATSLSVWAAWGFSREQTPIEPGYVSSALITDGPYRLTRNPIYLGMALSLVAWALWLGQPIALLGPLAFIALVNVRFIRHEERMLTERFGDDYGAYRRRVRRWL